MPGARHCPLSPEDLTPPFRRWLAEWGFKPGSAHYGDALTTESPRQYLAKAVLPTVYGRNIESEKKGIEY